MVCFAIYVRATKECCFEKGASVSTSHLLPGDKRILLLGKDFRLYKPFTMNNAQKEMLARQTAASLLVDPGWCLQSVVIIPVLGSYLVCVCVCVWGS